MRRTRRAVILYWITSVLFTLKVFSQDKIVGPELSNSADTSGDGRTSSSKAGEEQIENVLRAQLVPDATNKIKVSDWLPRLNITCVNGHLSLADNQHCRKGILHQRQLHCDKASYKDKGISGSENTCKIISERAVACTTNTVCDEWSEWSGWTNCCKTNGTCTFSGVTMKFRERAKTRTRRCQKDIPVECTFGSKIAICGSERANGDDGDGIYSAGGSPITANHVRSAAFGMVGVVMFGLLVFAAMRLRKNPIFRRRMSPGHRSMQGFDNDIGPASPGSRIQTILNTINSNGRNYELRERTDSTPGRRVYVLSPSAQDLQPAGRGRSMNRMMSQLSSIAEEETDDGLSQITEGTEPVEEDDCVFRYDSDAINEVDNMYSPSGENNTRTASSSEALNYINDVIAMYDVDNGDVEDDVVKDFAKKNSRMSSSDYRTSGDYENGDLLQKFGWKPQERSWKLEKLKDEDSKSEGKLSASCSTLASQFSAKSALTSSASAVSLPDANQLNVSSREPLLGSDEGMTPEVKSLKKPSEFKSLPSVLDTSHIPDIEEVMTTDNEPCDVTSGCRENGDILA